MAMDDLGHSIEQVRQQDLLKRDIKDLVREYNVRLYGPSTEDNLDRTYELGQVIQMKRADLQARLTVVERQLADCRAYIVIVGVLGMVQVLVSAYGRETVVQWLPWALAIYAVVAAVAVLRNCVRNARLKRRLFG